LAAQRHPPDADAGGTRNGRDAIGSLAAKRRVHTNIHGFTNRLASQQQGIGAGAVLVLLDRRGSRLKWRGELA